MKSKNLITTACCLFSISPLIAQSKNVPQGMTSPLMMFSGKTEPEPLAGSEATVFHSAEAARSREAGAISEWGSAQREERALTEGEVRDPELRAAQQAKQAWTAEKETAIQEVQTESNLSEREQNKKAPQQIRTAQEAQVALKNQASGFQEAIRTADANEAFHLRRLVRAYETAAEEAGQVELLWTLRQKKNGNKVSLLGMSTGVSLPGKKHEQLEAELEEATRWASLTPAERRSELLGADFYKEADRLWEEYYEAYDQAVGVRWALKNEHAIQEKIQAHFEQEEAALAGRNIQKTTLARISKGALKASEILEQVGLGGMSPAAITKATGIVADIINKRIERGAFREARQEVESHTQFIENLRQQAEQAKKIANEKGAHASSVEDAARAAEQAALPVLAKALPTRFKNSGPLENHLNALKKSDSAWDGDVVSIWQQQMRSTEQLAHDLEDHRVSQEELKALESGARDARSAVSAVEEEAARLEAIKIQQIVSLAEAEAQLRKIDDEILSRKGDSAITLDSLKTTQNTKQKEHTSLLAAQKKTDQELEAVHGRLAILEPQAVQAEATYVEAHKVAFNKERKIRKNIERAQARAHAEWDAYKTVWPEEAERNSIPEPLTVETTILPVKPFTMPTAMSPLSEKTAGATTVSTLTADSASLAGSERMPAFSEHGGESISTDRSNLPLTPSSLQGGSMGSESDKRMREALDQKLLVSIAEKMKRRMDLALQSFKEGKKNLSLDVQDQWSVQEQEYFDHAHLSQATEEIETSTLLEATIQEEEDKAALALEAYYGLAREDDGSLTTQEREEKASNEEQIRTNLVEAIGSNYKTLQTVIHYFEKLAIAEEQKSSKSSRDDSRKSRLAAIAQAGRKKN